MPKSYKKNLAFGGIKVHSQIAFEIHERTSFKSNFLKMVTINEHQQHLP